MRKLLLLLLIAPAALAQEFWLAPASYRVAVDAPTPLGLLLGDNFAGRAWARPTRRVRRFVRLGPGSAADTTDLRPALLADSLAPPLRCATAGTHTVVLTSQLAFAELPAAEFTTYLRQQGLGEALRQRQEAGVAATKPGREAYRRCAKALVLATQGPHLPPAAADTAFRQVLGLALELVPEQNPYRLRPGAALTVRVLSLGQPVPGTLVRVWQVASPALPAGPQRWPASPRAPMPRAGCCCGCRALAPTCWPPCTSKPRRRPWPRAPIGSAPGPRSHLAGRWRRAARTSRNLPGSYHQAFTWPGFRVFFFLPTFASLPTNLILPPRFYEVLH